MPYLELMIARLRNEITIFAKSIGFDVVGFTRAQMDQKYVDAYKSWIGMKYYGGMSYLADTKHVENRFDIAKTLPGVQSVIVLAMNYYRQQERLKRGHGRVARYAYGRDYHRIIGKKLRQLEDFICEKNPDAKTKHFVDIGPLMERALAQQAGVGVIGKNGLLITKEFGSWVLLGEILTTLQLTFEPDVMQKKESFSTCGSCTRCVQACPTGAIIAPGVVDARRCISYLTIEHKGRIPIGFAKIIKETKRMFGCDICQEVCPHNSRQKITTHTELNTPKIAGDSLFTRTIRAIKTNAMFHRLFAGSAIKRTKKIGLRRNAGVMDGVSHL